MKRFLFGVLLALLGPRLAFAGDIVVNNFAGGLDTLDTPAELDPSMAQDLLNVQLQPGGGAVFKRDGYGLFQTLPISCSTCAVHGGYHFQQVGGNDVQLWGNDGELAGSVNDATFVKLATGTVGATWQCADSQGSAYCLNSSRDSPIKTDGSVSGTSFQTGIPSGTMLAFTPLQLAVSGVTGNENTIYISQQNTFTTFTIGVLPSSAFIEPIASPGSRITHLAFYFGKLFWWKDQSFGYATFTNQNDWQLTIVSNQIGTLDNSDAFWNSSGFDSGSKFTGTAQANAGQSPGGIFFRGQDNHFYVYDGYYLTRISRPITPTVAASSRKKANAWTQTTQGDFQAGAIAGNLSTTISPGDVIVSSFGITDNSSSQWSSGTALNMTVGTSSISLATNNSGNITNPDFESSFSGNWTATHTGTVAFDFTQSGIAAGMPHCNFSPQSLSQMAETVIGTGSSSMFLEAIDLNSNLVAQKSVSVFNDCTWRQTTLSPSSSQMGQRVKFRLHASVSSIGDAYLTTSDSYIWGGPATFFYNSTNSGTQQIFGFDNIQNGSSTITSGSFTSKVYDTGFSSSTLQLQSSFSANTSTPTFALFTSASSGGPFTALLTNIGTNALGNRYVKYSSTISVASSDNALTAITSIAVVSRSTGTYYSAVNNASNLTSWGNFLSDDGNTISSSITYFIRSSTSSFTVLSATPTWISQTKNSQIVASTGTYMQMRGDFYVTVATEALALNDFQFNWFEGAASDKAYMTYFNDAIWFSVSSSSSSSTNNRIFYWDLLNGSWLIYDIPANGFQIENNALYFGDPVQGRIFKYGGVSTDNGLAINSYWRSKSFYAPSTINPYSPPSFEEAFNQKSFMQADFILGESSTTLAYTYTLDSKTSTTFNFTTYDSAASLIQRNFPLPPGKIGKYYDFRIGDNSSNQAWRIMGHRVHYNAEAWRPVLR